MARIFAKALMVVLLLGTSLSLQIENLEKPTL